MVVLALVDIEGQRIVRYEGRHLFGACNRCGECCRRAGERPCRHLVSDQEKPDGSPLWRCAIYWTRPLGCAFYPRPEQVLPGCGFYYDEVVSDG